MRYCRMDGRKKGQCSKSAKYYDLASCVVHKVRASEGVGKAVMSADLYLPLVFKLLYNKVRSFGVKSHQF
jgi:hypothetical protein